MSSQVSDLPRRAVNARQAETVERLLAAGGEELREVGVEALTIRSVALRAGVSAATAYTYFSSKNHLFAELFWRALRADPHPAPADDRPDAGPVERLQAVTRHMASMLAASPELAAGATSALLGTDADVERLRLRIGAEFVDRFRTALGDGADEGADEAVVEALTLAFSGALLQAGMGLLTYTEMGERLDGVVATIMKGHG